MPPSDLTRAIVALLRRRTTLASCVLATCTSAFAAAPVAMSPEQYVAHAAAVTGWSPLDVQSLLQQAQLQPRILELMDKPAEKSMKWYEYRSRIVSTERAAAGIVFLDTYTAAFARAEVEYGVPRQIVAAIIGMESSYGTNRGKYRVLDSLGTLSFNYPRRAAFFQKELTAFLVLAKAGHVDPLTIQGSYAGAIGYPQFMPTNISKLATDFDDDGHIDLYNSPVDAIGSVAKYLRLNGWKAGQPVAAYLETSAGSNLQMEGRDGPEYMRVEHNFKVIKRYNQSDMYALAVFTLSQILNSGAN
jgi:membrane-bound lytic murein transglycosylase B